MKKIRNNPTKSDIMYDLYKHYVLGHSDDVTDISKVTVQRGTYIYVTLLKDSTIKEFITLNEEANTDLMKKFSTDITCESDFTVKHFPNEIKVSYKV